MKAASAAEIVHRCPAWMVDTAGTAWLGCRPAGGGCTRSIQPPGSGQPYARNLKKSLAAKSGGRYAVPRRPFCWGAMAGCRHGPPITFIAAVFGSL